MRLAPLGMQNGATLLELLLVVGLVGLVSGILLPATGNARDRVAVRSAQDAFATAVRTARLSAPAAGGARLRVDLDSSRVALIRTGRPDQVLSLSNEFGVTLDARGARQPELRFDRVGLGRFTSRTFTLRRGSAVRTVVVSAYGRVDRR